MKCPVCKDTTLLMSERNGIEIDYCPECRGIWLDRGELDKLLEKENNNKNYHTEEIHNEEKYHNESKNKTSKKKRETFIGEKFDIFSGE